VEFRRTPQSAAFGYALGPDGARLISHPVTKAGKKVVEPQWMPVLAARLADAFDDFHRQIAPRRDALKDLRDVYEDVVSLAKVALVYDNAELRKRVLRMVNRAQRKAVAHGAAPDLAEAHHELAVALSTLVRRFEPARVLRDDTPTDATLAQLRPDPVKALLDGGLLDGRQKGAARTVRKVNRALTAKLDARAANLDGTGGGGERRDFRDPVEDLPPEIAQEYDANYRPWSLEMARRHWRWLPHQPKAAGGDAATFWTVVVALLIDGLDGDDCERQHRMPPGRPLYVLRLALSAYGR
jgi:hypothetical protein